MPAGSLRERVKIQQETQTPDGQGGYTLAWSDVASIWARVAPLRGQEQVAAAQLEDAVSYRVTIRHLDSVLPKMRVLWGSVPLNIRSVINPDEREKYMQLLCDRGVAV